MGLLSPGRHLAAFEAWITGYRSEHYKLGLQMVGGLQALLTLHLLPAARALADVWRRSLCHTCGLARRLAELELAFAPCGCAHLPAAPLFPYPGHGSHHRPATRAD